MNSSASRVAHRFLASTTREACIIATGQWDDERCLLKNRDRNYDPELMAYHEIREGVEVLYIRDELTGWLEGLNEHGIGIVNSALQVARDEGEKQRVKEKGKKSKDGARILKALSQKTLDEAVEIACTYQEGIKGHTLVSTPEKSVSIEHTRKHECVLKPLPHNKVHVRTNHGLQHGDAGYTEGSDDYVSSQARRDQAKKVLRQAESPHDLGPSIYAQRKKDRKDPTNMVRNTDNMKTSSQLVLNVSRREAYLYLIPGKVTFLGLKSKLPKGYKPQLKLEVYEYTDLNKNDEFEVTKKTT